MLGEPRNYRGGGDLDAMRSVLRAGRWANNGTYYVHCGDIAWWLHYPSFGINLFDQIFLWDDPEKPGRLLGWVLLGYDRFSTIDVIIQPELRGTSLAQEMFAWAEQRMSGILHSMGKDTIRVMWIFEDDQVMDEILRKRGFESCATDVHMVCELEGPMPKSNPPEGWEVRSCRGLEEVEARAMAQYGAFGSTAAKELYVGRFRSFMQSEVYNPAWDIVTVDEDGRIGSFCIIWPDPLNRVGLFEPVGTHPDQQRLGLGKAVMVEAKRKLQGIGMRQAIVTTAIDNEPAIRLYESAGFRIVNRLMTYTNNIAN